MKVNFKESLRQFLIRIVLPFRKKREVWLGNFRFSIAFRISLHYLKLLIINGVLFLCFFSLLFLWGEKLQMHDSAEVILEEAVEEGFPEENASNNDSTFALLGIHYKAVDNNTGVILFNNLEKDLTGEKKLFDSIYISGVFDESDLAVIVEEHKEVVVNGALVDILFQYDLAASLKELNMLLLCVGLLYLFLVYVITHFGKKSDRTLLEPIFEMSETANRLTVNNLGSRRLNVEGTKNELKDLAAVINNMLDRLEISYESQKQFVSDASHELRTPIAVIQGYANLLNRWGTSNKEVMLESIDAINNEAKAMQDLVEKLLFLSRHDKKTLKLDKHRFNMCDVVEEMVKETKIVVKDRVIEASVLQDVEVYGDKQALKQAIRIFIDNAVKYSEEGDTITITCQDDDGDCVINVSDTGLGMTRKDVEHIFERFYRSDQVRGAKIGGHGLGLSIAKLIVLGHTGKIKVRSQFTKGTTFTITLPRRF
ncbi:HAMP domain-containing sensor histidine kinase [Anaerocolumna sp. AGMB13020]|uniref:sensor histidine kinase n=1 Tax=Anaerocolumna sp. AGMB13020 TaxID=3081750 RepID=UPI002954161A|nr:HAMP domain-containing sensor histidine kinase [Anaerocolumna sp. AGMB13020]WOO34558.1 HAMP domain-containing sensor histidine kinase [Anaerocolumna sp. AGMB13020]